MALVINSGIPTIGKLPESSQDNKLKQEVKTPEKETAEKTNATFQEKIANDPGIPSIVATTISFAVSPYITGTGLLIGYTAGKSGVVDVAPALETIGDIYKKSHWSKGALIGIAGLSAAYFSAPVTVLAVGALLGSYIGSKVK